MPLAPCPQLLQLGQIVPSSFVELFCCSHLQRTSSLFRVFPWTLLSAFFRAASFSLYDANPTWIGRATILSGCWWLTRTMGTLNSPRADSAGEEIFHKLHAISSSLFRSFWCSPNHDVVPATSVFEIIDFGVCLLQRCFQLTYMSSIALHCPRRTAASVGLVAALQTAPPAGVQILRSTVGLCYPLPAPVRVPAMGMADWFELVEGRRESSFFFSLQENFQDLAVPETLDGYSFGTNE